MRAAILAVAATVIVCVIGLTAGERPKPKTHTVTMENMRFQPETLDGRTWRHGRLGQQGPGSTHRHVKGRRVRFTDHPGGEVLEIYRAEEGRLRLRLHVPSDDDGDATGQVTGGVPHPMRSPCHLYVPVGSDR